MLPSRVFGAIMLTVIMLFAAGEAARLLEDIVAGSEMLVQITDFGGRVINGSVIIVIGESGPPSVLRYAIIALSVAIGLIFGSAAVAIALAFGLGGRSTAHELLQRWIQKERKVAASGEQPPVVPPVQD